MKVRVLKGFNGYKVGQEFDWGDGMARVLIARGMVSAIHEEAIERAVSEFTAERAVPQQHIKKRPQK